MFKVRVRQDADDHCFNPGSEHWVVREDEEYFYIKDGSGGEGGWFKDRFERLPSGPIVTETVTKTRIVPGTYDRVHVGVTVDIPDCENPDNAPMRAVDITIGDEYYVSHFTADELDAAAAVLSALAKGLRDV